MRALCCIGALALLMAFAAPARAENDCVPELAKLRFEDDYTCFRDPANRDGFPGAIKFIPLNEDGDAFLSFGGDIRQRYEYTHNPLFGEDPQDEAGVWLQRFIAHGDLRFGPNLRLFGELFSALATGRESGPGPVDKNELALQNAFIDLSVAPAEDSKLTLRVGRQELEYGSGRLVDVRDGPNVRRTFDAARAIFEAPDWRVDGLAGRPRTPQPDVFDDETNDDQALWGIYASGGAEMLPFGAIDLYYLGFKDDAGTFVQGTARERRHSIGARFHGEDRGWDWNWEAVYQFGTFGDGSIQAWTLASDTGFTFSGLPWRPRLALSANVASGDGDPDNEDLGTFNPLFPRGNYFSEAAVLGPRNFFNLHPFLTVSPTDRWSLTTDVNFFWRLETEDGVYAPAGQIIRAPGGSDQRFVGSAISLASEYALAENLVFTAIYTHFFAGDFIRATGPSEDIDFFELTVQFRF